jgi:hypothetical protein
MRNGQKRMRGRSSSNNSTHRKSQNPLTRLYESNGPDVKIRGTASHIAEKYIQLARDSQSSGDPVAAENYYQHAEHYFRLIAAAQEQFRQQNPYYNQQQQGGAPQGAADDNFDDGDDDSIDQSQSGQNEPHAPREQPQPYLPRDAQPFQPREYQQQQNPPQQHQGARPQNQPQHQPSVPQPSNPQGGNIGGLPSFITGGSQPQPQNPNQGFGQNPGQNPGNGPNGHDQFDRGQDRHGMHRRRRHHRGPRNDLPNQPQQGQPQNQPQPAQPQTIPSQGGDEPPRQPGD